jgi:hypothetical protein
VCGNHRQRVNGATNDNPIEQVSAFIYLISEYKSDWENKLQAYIKINGIMRRHFGKKIAIETKLGSSMWIPTQ